MYGYPYYANNFQNYGNIPQQNNNINPISSQDDRIWVSNQQAGEAYLISPNGFARLWDSNAPRFYEKRADSTGRPLPMEIYEYKRVTPQINALADDTQKLSYDEINAKIEAINERIEALEKAKKGAVKNGTKSNDNDTSIQ